MFINSILAYGIVTEVLAPNFVLITSRKVTSLASVTMKLGSYLIVYKFSEYALA